MSSWETRQAELAAIAEKQLFFVGGAPRSGTTWLQSLLDAHPQISCRGEGLFMQNLAKPIDEMFAQRRDAIANKNKRVFRHVEGYPLPDEDHSDHLLGTAVLLALRQQCLRCDVRAIGEKTPENVFFFPRLMRIFPRAKFIALARDPRDVLASAWHFFRNEAGSGPNEKIAFLRSAFPSINDGARATMAFAAAHPSHCLSLTYEALLGDTSDWAGQLYGFLGVATDPATIAASVEGTSFRVMTQGRAAGSRANGSFYRSGTVGSWQDTFDETMNQMIVQELGWMFEHYGWKR